MPRLTDPLTLPCGVQLPNRLLKSAMTEGLADLNDNATERHANLYRVWADGGTGTLVTGNVMVDRRFLERPGNVVIDGNGGAEMLQRWAAAGTGNNNQLWMQINHPGRQCQKVVAGHPLAPSDVQLGIPVMFGKPRAMTQDDIEAAISGYVRVAEVAQQAGFTGVQIHSAHGYLCSQFLSPIANRRDDEWGGSLANRARFLLEIIRRVRAAVGSSFPVAIKLNSADFSRGGFTFAESLQVAQWVSEAGIDLLEISGGTYEKMALMGERSDAGETQSTQAREAYFLEYAGAIREVTGVPLAITGGFRRRATMQAALDEGLLDVIGLGRPLCTQPDVHALLNGESADFARWEDKLRIGPGWLGPRSSSRMLVTLNFAAATQWYYQQIIRLSEGRPLLDSTGILAITLRHTLREQRFNKQRTFNRR